MKRPQYKKRLVDLVTDAILSEFSPEIQEHVNEMTKRTGIRVEGKRDRIDATMRVFDTEEEAKEWSRGNIEPDMEVGDD